MDSLLDEFEVHHSGDPIIGVSGEFDERSDDDSPPVANEAERARSRRRLMRGHSRSRLSSVNVTGGRPLSRASTLGSEYGGGEEDDHLSMPGGSSSGGGVGFTSPSTHHGHIGGGGGGSVGGSLMSPSAAGVLPSPFAGRGAASAFFPSLGLTPTHASAANGGNGGRAAAAAAQAMAIANGTSPSPSHGMMATASSTGPFPVHHTTTAASSAPTINNSQNGMGHTQQASSWHARPPVELPSESDVLRKYTTAGGRGVISVARSTKDIHKRIQAHSAARHLEKLREELASTTDRLDMMRMKLELEKDQLQFHENAIEDAEDELDYIREEVQDDLARLPQEAVLNQRIEVAHAKVKSQRAVVEATQREFGQVDKERDVLTYKLHEYHALDENLADDKLLESHEAAILAKYKHMKAAQRAARQEQKRVLEAALEEKHVAERALISEATRRSNHAITARLQRDLRRTQEEEEKLNRGIAESHHQRAQAVLALKKSTAAAQAQLAGHNEARHKRIARINNEREKERRELRDAGRNPDAVFGARDEAARQQAHVAKMKAKVTEKALVIMDRMVHEDLAERKKEKEARKHVAAVAQYRRAMGRSILENAVAEHMKLKANGNAALNANVGLGGLLSAARSLPSVSSSSSSTALLPNVGSRDLPAASTASGSTRNSVTIAGEPPLGDDSSDSDDGDDVDRIGESTTVSTSHGHHRDMKEGAEKKKIPIMQTEQRLKQAKKKVADALARQTEAQARGVKKVVCGKEYTTAKFLSNPVKVVFKDFDVGQSYTQKLVITNVSFSFNTFKILPLTDEYIDFFEVAFTPVGRMSAGSTATITITFRPKVNEDILTELPMMAETGPFSIPLECYTKKAIINVSPRVLDLGAVILGESGTHHVTVVNDGALGVPFTVTRVRPVDAARPPAASGGSGADEDDASISLPPIPGAQHNDSIVFASQGVAAGYSKTPFAFTFNPLVEGATELKVKFVFGGGIGSDGKPSKIQWGSASEFEVLLKATGSAVPIYVEKEVVDLQCCVYDKLYRGICRLQNRSASALKAQVMIPKALQDYVEFTPKVGYVQKHAHLDIVVKFTPTEGILDHVAKYFPPSPQQPDLIDVPVTVIVPDQALPVTFRVRAQCVSSKLQFSTTAIDFGKCYTSQSSAVPLTIINNSPILQKVWFVTRRADLTIMPRPGFMTILPFRKKIRNIVFSPKSATDAAFNLEIRTKLGDSYTIACQGVGIKPPVDFSESIMRFAAVPFGDTVFASTFVTNTSNVRRSLHFIIPPPPSTVAANGGTAANQPFLTASFSSVPPTATTTSLTSLPPPPSTSDGKETKSSLQLPAGAVLPPATPTAAAAPVAPTPPPYDDSFLTVSPQVMVLEPGQTSRVQFRFSPQLTLPTPLPPTPPPQPEIKEPEPVPVEEPKKGARSGSASRSATTAAAGATTGTAVAAKREKKKRETPAEIAAREEKERIEREEKERHDRDEAEKRRGEDLKRAEDKMVMEREQKRATELVEPSNALEPEQSIEITGRWLNDDPHEPWSRHGRHRLPVYIRNDKDGTYTVMYLQAYTTVVRPTLEVTPPELDFGQLAFGQSLAKTIEITNISRQQVPLTMDALGLSSSFHILNAPRVLPAGESHLCVIEFRPQKQKKLRETLTIRSQTAKVDVTLMGHCITPTISIEPTSGLLDMGDILPGDSVTKSLTMRNTSQFPFSYVIAPEEKISGERNLRGQAEFYFVPNEGTIQPGESHQVACHFSPDHASTAYVTIIKVGGHYIRVEGRCHSRQLYLHGGEIRSVATTGGVTQTGDGDYQNPLSFLDQPSDLYPGIMVIEDMDDITATATAPSATPVPAKSSSTKDTKEPGTARSGGGTARTSTAAKKAVPRSRAAANDAKLADNAIADAKQIVLTFKPSSSAAAASSMLSGMSTDRRDATAVSSTTLEPVSMQVAVGSCSLPANEKKAASSSFDVQLLANDDGVHEVFTVTPDKGTLDSGTRKMITFTFDPARYEARRRNGPLNAFAGGSQWLTCSARVTLYGGVIPQSAAANASTTAQIQVIDIQLRLYVTE